MKRLTAFIILFSLVLVISSNFLFAQNDEDYYKSLLREEVTVENPVYMPVIGVGLGVLNFYGEVHDKSLSPLLNKPTYKINVATFLDRKNHYFRTNFYIMFGSMQGEVRSLDTAFNKNFQSDIINFGINLHYDFKNFLKTSPVRPFVSIGIENVQFNSKTDLFRKEPDGTLQPYYYWTDGTIRNISEEYKTTMPSSIVQRDFKYETDLRGNNQYSQSAFAVPIEAGLDFKISDRLNVRVAYALHYTFTDNIDNVSKDVPSTAKYANSFNDMFSYTYFSVHFDMFSDKTTKTIEKLFADVDHFDYELLADEDNDGVLDGVDQCPHTPYGVQVDTLTGCPLDGDKDGIPDYLDKQRNTPPGAMVDDYGVEITPDQEASLLNVDGIKRRDVDAFLLLHRAQNHYYGKSSIPIPAKFKKVDTDGDNYISFDEFLKAINDYFDFKNDFSSKDIYDLQDFFFEQ